MRDARAIRFAGRRRTGVGTSFERDTRVGPLRLTGRMVVTERRTGRSMGIRHQGIVTGSGRFTLHTARGGRTRFTWEERLSFPWWMGGPFGAMAGAFVLRRIWRK